MKKIPVRLTTIVATLGPATAEEAMLERLIGVGMDVARLNFSHGDYSSHAEALERLRRAAERKGKFVAVLQDLAGPKIRLRTPEARPVKVAAGGRVRLCRRLSACAGPAAVATTYEGLVDDCRVGEPLLLADGLLRMRIAEKHDEHLVLESEDEGDLSDEMGVNLPQTQVRLESMTQKDWRDLEWGLERGVDYVALSFVRTAAEVRAVREFVRKAGSEARVIAKIEKPQAVAAIDAILDEGDGLMVARGDLGVEMDVAEVPVIQKDLIRRAARAGVPVITATQMLQSMITEPRPTRAEVSDVANAVFDGSDALMLSGETAVGRYPVRAVEMMARIIDLVEDYAQSTHWPTLAVESRYRWSERAVALGAAGIARDLGVRLVIALTHSGTTALLLSKQWMGVPILAISDRRETCCRMALYRGVTPVHHPGLIGTEELVGAVERMALERKLVAAGDRVLIISGRFPGRPGGTDTLSVHTVSGALRERGAE
ncbi:MAG TPA: pyruvate kinase [Phycisphaerae bacterium]|nr:pyruvate kinase [Phycisphaerae bacterium]